MSRRRSWADIESDAKLDFDPRSTADYQRTVWQPKLSALIRSARENSDLSQSSLASEMKSNQPNIARLENGASLPTIETVARIAIALGKHLVIGIVDDDDFVNSDLTELAQEGRIATIAPLRAKSKNYERLRIDEFHQVFIKSDSESLGVPNEVRHHLEAVARETHQLEHRIRELQEQLSEAVRHSANPALDEVTFIDVLDSQSFRT